MTTSQPCKLCKLLFFAFAMLALGANAEAKQATLFVAGYTGSTTLTDFQALVKLSASNDAYGFSYAEAEADGSDLWFTDANGNVIPHEIDTWNSSGDSLVWVKIPSLKKGTEIVMHWGDLNTKQTATENTWTGFVGVWHMNGTGTTAEPDSTTNSLSATPKITSGTANIDTATGKVGKGRSNIANARLEVASTYKNKITTASQFTVGGWFKMNRTDTKSSGSYPRILTGNGSTGTRNTWEVWQNLDANAASDTLRVLGGSNSDSIYSGTRLVASQWAYLMVVYNGAKATLYLDGVSKGEKEITAATHKNAFSIGAIGTTASRSLVGVMDEVRMYNGTLSADRIAADYATMNNPTNFLALKPEVVIVRAEWSGGAGDGDVTKSGNWNCYDQNGDKVEGGLPSDYSHVLVFGDNLKFQAPIGTELQYASFVLSNATLAANCDLRGLGEVTVADNAVIDLKDYALFVQGLAGDGVITNSANGTYTTLDYIQADNETGSQYIITDYTPAYSDTFLTKVNYQNVTRQCIYCARGSGVKTGDYTCLTADLNLRFDHVDSQGSLTLAPATNKDYDFVVNGKTGVCMVNGTNVYTMAKSDDDSATAASVLSFFKLNNNAGTEISGYVRANFKMYRFRIYGYDGALKADFVPASDGDKAGLWDRVGGKFYPSSGSEAFIPGEAKGRGELVFYVPSGATATRSGVTIDESVIVSKEGAGTLNENALGYDKTKASAYDQREGTVNFSPSTGNYLDMGPTYCISGGKLTPSNSHLHIGRERTGKFIQNGGTVDMSTNNVVVGISGSGEYDLTGGKLTVTDLQVGANGSGHGEVEQTGGEVNVSGTLSVPNGSTASGAYGISGGTLAINNAMIGNNGSGTFIQRGGKCTISGYPWIGAIAGGVGLYEMTGGTLSASSYALSVGRFGTGTLNVSGSAVVTASKGIRVGLTHTDGTGSGTLVVTNGGTIVTTSIYGGGTTREQASVLFDGATIRATAKGDILKDLYDVTIGPGGLTITNNVAVSDLFITNTTITVKPGYNTVITKQGTNTLDIANATFMIDWGKGSPKWRFNLFECDYDETIGELIKGTPSLRKRDGTELKGYEFEWVDRGGKKLGRVKRKGAYVSLR